MVTRITQEDCRYKDEMYCDWYECPNCHETMLFEECNYCPICGIEVTFIE